MSCVTVMRSISMHRSGRAQVPLASGSCEPLFWDASRMVMRDRSLKSVPAHARQCKADQKCVLSSAAFTLLLARDTLSGCSFDHGESRCTRAVVMLSAPARLASTASKASGGGLRAFNLTLQHALSGHQAFAQRPDCSHDHGPPAQDLCPQSP